MSEKIDITNMPGVAYRIDKSIVQKLRDAAIDSAIEAEVRKEKWEYAVTELAELQVAEKFGWKWRGMEGEIQFSDGNVLAKLVSIVAPSWRDTEPQMVYHRKLKSGRYSKVDHEQRVSYILQFFRST